MPVLYVRGFSSGRGNFETAPHIDTWTNEKTVNGDKDVSIGGIYFMGRADVRYCNAKADNSTEICIH